MNFMSEKNIEKMSAKLGLKYHVEMHPAKDITCRISTDTQNKIHRITVDQETLQNDKRASYLIAHELCHAALAERLDISFSCMPMAAWYPEKNVQQAFLCWILPVDWWANSLRYEVWPELLHIELAENCRELRGARKAASMLFENLEMRLIFSLTLAENSFRGENFDFSLGQIMKAVPFCYHKQIHDIKKLLLSLPELPSDRNQALGCLAGATYDMAKILGFPAPKIEITATASAWRIEL